MGQPTAKILILIGLVITLAGIIFYFFGDKLNFLGKLPGDIRVEKENFNFYFPITTCILISILATAIIKLVQWFLNK
jgi:hypothetical protein